MTPTTYNDARMRRLELENLQKDALIRALQAENAELRHQVDMLAVSA